MKKKLGQEDICRLDLKKKWYIRWDIDGDESFKFFHGVVNNNRRKNRINGLNVNGVQVNDPFVISSEVKRFFAYKFNEPMYNRPKSVSDKFKNLSKDDRAALKDAFSEIEIKVVWGCGNDKALDPIYFQFFEALFGFD